MKNLSLTQDYIRRSMSRLKAIETLYHDKNWPDVVRESQEAVELCLKALLRHSRIEVPRIHDVSDILLDHQSDLPPSLHNEIKKITDISRALRRDRELAFYGSEDLTPSEFYKEEDAKKAMEQAKWLIHKVSSAISKTK